MPFVSLLKIRTVDLVYTTDPNLGPLMVCLNDSISNERSDIESVSPQNKLSEKNLILKTESYNAQLTTDKLYYESPVEDPLD